MRRVTRVAPPGAAGLALLATLFVAGSCAQAGKRANLPPEPLPASSAPVPPLPPPPAPPSPPSPGAVPLPPAAAPVPAGSPAPAPPRPFTGWVRIGLATDLESVTLPCCEGELSVDVGGARLDVASPLRIRPAATSVGGATYRVQIAALKDEQQAKELARRLGTLAAEPADARFDAQAGIYRVRIGRFAERAAAEEAGRKLARFGVDSSWIVSEGAALGEAALDLLHRGKSYRVAGRSFVLSAPAAPADTGVRWEGRRYRGRLVVYLNDRGRLNLVNELPIEQYLRGVVPRELGPGAYPELEALKAQAIAARSYTLRNLGEFADEGYDLCGTPRCQVYGGMDDEHPLSDRAVAETAGEILVYGGQPIDALYSATCGGHTENVEVIFPLKRAPYLRGVPCIEAGEVTLASAVPGPVRLSQLLLERALPGLPAELDSAAKLEGALVRLAAEAGLATPEDHLARLERREVQRFLGSLFDLAADARLFVRPEELGYLVVHPPAEWNAEDRRLAAYLVKSGLLAAPTAPAVDVTPREAEELLLQLALFLRLVERREASFTAVEGGPGAAGASQPIGVAGSRGAAGRELVARANGAELHFALPGNLATFRLAGTEARAGSLVLEAGDVLHLFLVGGGRASTAPTTCLVGRASAATRSSAPRWPAACRASTSAPSRSSCVASPGGSASSVSSPETGRRSTSKASLCAGRSTCPTPFSPRGGSRRRRARRAGSSPGAAGDTVSASVRSAPTAWRGAAMATATSSLTTTAAQCCRRSPMPPLRRLQLPLRGRRGSIAKQPRSPNGLFPHPRTAGHS